MLALSVVAVALGRLDRRIAAHRAASPLVIVVGYETVGWRHQAAVLERERAAVSAQRRGIRSFCYRDRMSANLTTWWPAR